MSVRPLIYPRQALARRARFTGGPLGEAQERNRSGRLAKFVCDEESDPIRLFDPSVREHCATGDWYGEHAGKWLVAAASATRNTGNPDTEEVLRRVTRFLISTQEEGGYLGTYSLEAPSRLSNPEIKQTRTWDVWTHAWMMMGLITAAGIPGCESALPAAAKIGDMLVETFMDTGRSILDYGNHQGLSSAIVVEPLARLSLATGDPQYFNFAWKVLQDLESRGVHVLSAASRHLDVSELGTGKIYQICWLLTGMVVLHELAPELPILENVIHCWQSIKKDHLNPLGGPWGGIATHKEVFNMRGFFHPSGMVETCSTTSWMALNRELFLLTGETTYSSEYERSLLNALMGAQDANGEDWCYFTFPNGRRNNTYFWACCKSSGAMALEEASLMMATSTDREIYINLLVEGDAQLEDGKVSLRSSFQSDGARSQIDIESSRHTSGRVRMPDWGKLTSATVNGLELTLNAGSNEYLEFEIRPGASTRVELVFACTPQVHDYTDQLYHHGQEIARTDYACLSWGPFVYATSPLNGQQHPEVLRWPHLNPARPVSVQAEDEYAEPTLRLSLPARPIMEFHPYYRAGGQHNQAWRTTWLEVAWQ